MVPTARLAFLTGAPGYGEMIVLFLVILVFFGPKRLPRIAKMIGKTLNDLRESSQEFRDQIMNIDDSEPEHIESPPATISEDTESCFGRSGTSDEEPVDEPGPAEPDDSESSGESRDESRG